MHLSAILMVAMLGQVVEIAPGEASDRIGQVVAQSLADMDAWTKQGSIALDPSKPVPVGMLATGTKLRVISEAPHAFGGETLAFLTAEVLDGPLKGSRAIVSKRRTRPAEGDPSWLHTPEATPGYPAREVVLGLALNGHPMPTFVFSTPLDLVKYLPETIDGKGLTRPVAMPMGAAAVGYLVRARIVGDAILYTTNDHHDNVGYVVEILDGLAKGRTVVVSSLFVKPVPSRADELRRTAAKQHARRTARTRAGIARERAQAAAEAQAESEYRKALPAILERQRRQAETFADLQRAAALQRMAGAAEREATAAEYRAKMPRMASPFGGTVAVP